MFDLLVKEGTLAINIPNNLFDSYITKFRKCHIIIDVDAYSEFMDVITNNGNYKTVFLKKDVSK